MDTASPTQDFPPPANTPPGTSPNSAPSSTKPAPDEAERILAHARYVARANAAKHGDAAPRSLGALVEAAMPKVVATPQQIREHEELLARIERNNRLADARALLVRIPAKYRDLPPEPDWDGIPERLNAAVPGQPAQWKPVREPYRRTFARLLTLERKTGGALVVLLGDRGSGKTWMASCLVQRFCRSARPAMYSTIPDYCSELRATYGDRGTGTEREVENRYLRPELLVLDEGEEKTDTAAQQQALTRLVNKRLMAESLTLIVSNDSRETLPDRIGRSLFDRIADGGGILVCDWPSLRGRIGG